MADGFLHILMRPLSISMLEEPLPANVSDEPGDIALRIIATLLCAQEGKPLDNARARYRQVSDESDEPLIVPEHPTIISHILRPLMEAKHCYVFGMPVACIAQSGLVGEMVALWRFQMLSTTINGNPLDEKMQESLMGRKFDKLGQEQRVKALRVLDTIDDLTFKTFNDLRVIRNSYLHLMTEATKDIDADARRAFKLACFLIVKTLGVQFDEGRIILPEKVARFVKSIAVADSYLSEG